MHSLAWQRSLAGKALRLPPGGDEMCLRDKIKQRCAAVPRLNNFVFFSRVVVVNRKREEKVGKNLESSLKEPHRKLCITKK